MAPLDAVHEAVTRTVEAGTARLRISVVVMAPAPYCTLAKHAQLDFTRRVALVADPPWSALDQLGYVMGQRWPWLDPDAPEATPSLHRTLHVEDRRFDDFEEEGWMRFAQRPDPGPFGIFDRLALADAAVSRDGLLRFRTVAEDLVSVTQYGDLRLDEQGRVSQVVFQNATPHRARTPQPLRMQPTWTQVDVVELGGPVDIEVPGPLPDMHEPDPDPEPMWKLAVGLWRRRRAYRAGTGT